MVNCGLNREVATYLGRWNSTRLKWYNDIRYPWYFAEPNKCVKTNTGRSEMWSLSINEITQLRQFCLKTPTWRRVRSHPTQSTPLAFLVCTRLRRDVSRKIRSPKMFSVFSRKLVSKRYEWFLPLNSQFVCSLTKLYFSVLSSPLRLDAVPCISLLFTFTGLNHFWLLLGSIPTLIFMNKWTILRARSRARFRSVS